MRSIIFLLLFTVCNPALSQTEEDAVKAVVTSAYIEGIHNQGDVANIRKGFHPTFAMLRMIDNEIKPLPIEEWIRNIEKAKSENVSVQPRTEGKFINVDITGTAAVVKLEIYREGKKIFTDYLVLYKFTEGWRIVSKTFYRHS